MLPRMERTCTSARIPPSPPGEALTSAHVFPEKATSGGSSSLSTRETQSMVFFSAAVMELLYSGEAISNPW